MLKNFLRLFTADSGSTGSASPVQRERNPAPPPPAEGSAERQEALRTATEIDAKDRADRANAVQFNSAKTDSTHVGKHPDCPIDPGEPKPAPSIVQTGGDASVTAPETKPEGEGETEDLNEKTKDELLEIANSEGVEGVNTHCTKAEIVEAIQAKRGK